MVGEQEGHHPADLDGLDVPVHLPRPHLPVKRVGRDPQPGGEPFRHPAQHGRVDASGTDRVDVDAVRGPFGRQGAREADDGGLGGVVRGHVGVAHLAGVGRHVHDGAALPRADHLAARCLAGPEQAGEVHPQLGVPVFGGHVRRRRHAESARVVDPSVEGAQGFDATGDGVFEASAVRDVELQGDRVTAALAHQLGRLRGGPEVEVPQRDLGSRLGQGFGDAAANPAGGAGDEHDPSLQQHRRPAQKAFRVMTPPSTVRLAPVIQRAAGEARKRQASATSSG